MDKIDRVCMAANQTKQIYFGWHFKGKEVRRALHTRWSPWKNMYSQEFLLFSDNVILDEFCIFWKEGKPLCRPSINKPGDGASTRQEVSVPIWSL